jgi:prepilin-type processing-associated H-X9-DG protein
VILFSYGYNGMGHANSTGSVADGTHKGLGLFVGTSSPRDECELPASRVRVPEDMIAIADGTVDGKVEGSIAPLAASGSYAWPGNVHGGGANVLFCDGHVQWYLQKELVVELAPEPSQRHRVRRWNNDHGTVFDR